MGLVGKKKIVVDRDIYANVSFSDEASDIGATSTTIIDQQSSTYVEQHNCTHLPAPAKDKLRIALGRNWDHREHPDTGKKIFSNKWGPLGVFYGDFIEMLPCEDTEQMITLDEASGTNVHLGTAYKDRILLKGQGRRINPEDQPLFDWIHCLKTGMHIDGVKYSPLIKTGVDFYDHHYEAQTPFTPYELLSKQPTSNSFFADYKTSYNERINSKSYETFLQSRADIDNAIPSIYGFLRMLNNKKLAGNEIININDFLEEIYYDIYNPGFDALEGFQSVPLETQISLFGLMDEDIYETTDTESLTQHALRKLITMNYDTIDADALFEEYINRWAYLISSLNFNPEDNPIFHERLTDLENVLSNLAFSPNIFKIYDKLEKYKKHFPFYSEIEFTAEKSTLVGDLMKKLFMTRFMSYELAASTDAASVADQTLGANIVTSAQLSGVDTAINDLQFYDFSGEDLYSDLSNAQPEISSGAVSAALTKRTINLPLLLQRWMEFDPYWSKLDDTLAFVDFMADEDNPLLDVRKYTTFFSDDVNEPPNIDDSCNTIFKNLFGPAFQAKIAEIYNQNRRSYQDILNGRPAYYEDIFYRIEKIRIQDGWNGTSQIPTQNIFIPNTSDLDIVKYVDTQVKYGNTEHYKYNVYAERLVFGSRYKYHWADEFNEPHPEEYNNFSGDEIYLDGASGDSLADAFDADEEDYLVDGLTIQYNEPGSEQSPFETTIALRVDIVPSIKIIEDKIFSTPDIIILDNPPPPPEVNIVPYRAVNNQIKIMLDGVINRFRAKPIVIMDTDIAAFDKIKKAQLVIDGSGNPLEDGKVQFGSDDPVQGFQIFRTTVRPGRYTDFELHQQIDSQDLGVYEEFILPNKKYYYIFRALDSRGHFSNPTEVYEVELIDEKGAVKPIIRTIEIKPKELKTMTKECQKHIYLKPSLKQLYFSDELEDGGVFSDSSKKKRYKMRITSKGSGKKIDINFSLKKKPTTN